MVIDPYIMQLSKIMLMSKTYAVGKTLVKGYFAVDGLPWRKHRKELLQFPTHFQLNTGSFQMPGMILRLVIQSDGWYRHSVGPGETLDDSRHGSGRLVTIPG